MRPTSRFKSLYTYISIIAIVRINMKDIYSNAIKLAENFAEFSTKPFGRTTIMKAGVAKPVGVSISTVNNSKPANNPDAAKFTGHSEGEVENTETFAESKPLNNLKKSANCNSEVNKFAELNQKDTGLPSPANNSINYELRGNDIEQWIKSAKDM